jgi:hypothetical protein
MLLGKSSPKRRRTFFRDPDFEHYLTDHGVEWELLDEDSHLSLENQWYEVFGNAIPWHCRNKCGARAEAELQAQEDTVFFVVPFLGDSRSLPTGIGSGVPRGAAYKCQGKILGLGGFRSQDKFVVPPDFSWCMIYTHEDYMLTSGPVFFRREWIVQPRETVGKKRRGGSRHHWHR